MLFYSFFITQHNFIIKLVSTLHKRVDVKDYFTLGYKLMRAKMSPKLTKKYPRSVILVLVYRP